MNDENFDVKIEKSAGGQGERSESLISDDSNNLKDLYFVTYKFNEGKSVSVERKHYDQVRYRLEQKGTIRDYCYERDSTGRLHFHCLFRSRPNLLLRMFNMKGYSCKIINVYDESKLIEYIYKLDKNDNSTIDNTRYMF